MVLGKIGRGMFSWLLGAVAVLFMLFPAVAQHTHAVGGNEVNIIATEEGFDSPETLEAGYTTFTLQNETETDYSLTIYRLEEGVTAEEAIAAGDAVDAAFEGEGDPLEALQTLFSMVELLAGPGAHPGASGRQGIMLEPGQYVISGEGFGEEGRLYGTHNTLEVTESADPAPAPEAAAKVAMVNFAFAIPAGLTSGTQLWELTNPSDQVHHMIIIRLHEGKTLADVMAFMEAGEEGEPPGDEVAHVSPVSPGQTVFPEFDLEAGEYIAACFIPDHGGEEMGPPHAMLGMMQQFSVVGD